MPPIYQERYCAFVDILGFSALVDQLRRGAVSSDMIRDLLRIIHDSPSKKGVRKLDESDLRAQSISDALCISAEPTASGLQQICHVIQQLAIRLLVEGFFIRGAIVKGGLYHDDKMVFGEALVRAYRLEPVMKLLPVKRSV